MDQDTDGKPNSNYRAPSPFQRRTYWIALTALAIVVIAVIGVGGIVLTGKVLNFLQPILVPLAVAGIIAYLLEPVVHWLRRRFRWKHKTAMLTTFSVFMALILILIAWVVVPSFGQAREFVEDWSKYQVRISENVSRGFDAVQEKLDNPVAQKYSEQYYDKAIEWLSEEGPKVGQKLGGWIWDKLMGFLGLFGYLLGFLLVPIYLYFFLKESHSIKKTWSDYIPLRASKFKDEVVDTLQEINQYLISFFRGQMVVSLIDGALVAIALSLVLQLPYALLIGVFLAILGLIPYIGNIMVMIPAVLIAIAHFGEKGAEYVDLNTEVQAGTPRYVKIAGGSEKKRKYVTGVQQVYRVKVMGGNGSLIDAYIPIDEPDPKSSGDENTETAVEPEPFKAPEVGQKRLVHFDGTTLTDKTTIALVVGKQKRVEYMSHAWSYLPNMWFYPLIVIAIFIILQQINGFVTAPKIVGDSVGLHPLTVIFSVLFWSFLLGGLLGALLAVPLTASIKVLFRRYIWVKRIEPKVGPFGGSASGDDKEKGEAEAKPAT